jgi:polyisoprenoid-binding protein YceI
MLWKQDNAHSEILFSVRHMMISKVRGQFDKFETDVNLDLDHPENTTVEARIEAASINTSEPDRDAHLKSPDFLNAEKYPYLVFKSTKVEVLDKNHAKMTGDLTIQDVTRPVIMDVEYAGLAKSPWGANTVGFTASTKISRKNWNLNWNVALETGGWLVGDEIEIDIQLELAQVPEEEAQPQAEMA